jgi:hypothetical protein
MYKSSNAKKALARNKKNGRAKNNPTSFYDVGYFESVELFGRHSNVFHLSLKQSYVFLWYY